MNLTYGINESAVCRTIQKIKNTLMKSEQFRLSNKKELQTSSIEFEIVLVDATEQPVERPQKNSSSVTVAKKCHTQEAQMIADRKDFQLFKESGVELPPHVLLLVDAGYQGVAEIHPNSQTPFKKTKLQ